MVIINQARLRTSSACCDRYVRCAVGGESGAAELAVRRGGTYDEAAYKICDFDITSWMNFVKRQGKKTS